jgi:hypothetical protein
VTGPANDITGKSEEVAQLFAAAPELLERLRKLEEVASKVALSPIDFSGTGALVSELVDQCIYARRAIAKAEGR